MNRLTSLTLAATLACAAATAPAALAGPDDGKTVITHHHIDSPKAFYDAATDSYRVVTEYANHQQAELDSSLIWIGKGWERSQQRYQLTIPDNDLFDYANLKRTGTYYTAPAVIASDPTPVWWGFGADDSVHPQDFKDGKLFLDLVGINGPGQAEFFGFYDYAYPEGLNKILGTSAKSPHSYALNFGQHTHNYSLFTKPGRYELSYRLSGRKPDNSLMQSDIQHLVVQVGGQQPKDTATKPVQERYDAAPAGDLASARYSFGVAPLAEDQQQYAGDEHLDHFTFEANDPEVEGTLTLLIDGYHLTDLDVRGGKASWDELMGPESSHVQAVFVPRDGKGTRWMSPPLNREVDGDFHVVPATVSTPDTASSVAAPAGNPRAVIQSGEQYVPDSDIKFTTTISRASEDAYKVSFDFDDPNFRGQVVMNAGDEWKASIEHGHGERVVSYSDLDGEEISVQAFPHSTIAVDASAPTTPQAVATPEYSDDEDAAPFDPIVIDGGVLKRIAPADPETPAAPETPAEPAPSPTVARCGDRILLDHGHTDLMVGRTDDALTLHISDQTGTEKPEFVDRRLDDVINVVNRKAQYTLKDGQHAQGLDFLDAKYLESGNKYYQLPEFLGDKTGILWPGYNTTQLDMKDFNGGVNWHMTPVSTPDNGQFGLYFNADLDEPAKVIMNSVTKDFEENIDYSSHTHMNWVFSKPGVYKFTTYFEGTTTAGKKISSSPETLSFVVGQTPGTECAAFDAAEGDAQQGDAQQGITGKDDAQQGDAQSSSYFTPIIATVAAFLSALLSISVVEGILNFIRHVLAFNHITIR